MPDFVEGLRMFPKHPSHVATGKAVIFREDTQDNIEALIPAVPAEAYRGFKHPLMGPKHKAGYCMPRKHDGSFSARTYQELNLDLSQLTQEINIYGAQS